MIRKIVLLVVVLGYAQPFLFSQPDDTITDREISRMIHYLASDSLKGRGNARPELLQAGLFIGNEFSKDKLLPLPGSAGFFLPFRPFGGSKEITTDFLLWNNKPIPPFQFLLVRVNAGNYVEKNLRDFKTIQLDTLFTEDVLKRFANDTSCLLLWTNKKQANGEDFFPDKLQTPSAGLKKDILLVYSEVPPETLRLNGNPIWYSTLEYNVVGVLPGKSKPNEVVIFSAHYDHEGVYGNNADSILNGANDNASGTTALIALAEYYSKKNDNERTLMFCAFAGEEMGMVGSSDFVTKINPKAIITAINIEMIGIPEFGKNCVFLTGERYSTLAAILRKGFKRSKVTLRSEFDEGKQLFKRSDNFPFVLAGIPAHTIMGSSDEDPCYHQPCDEVKRIDIANLTRLVRAIAVAAEPLISGIETPSRISNSMLR